MNDFIPSGHLDRLPHLKINEKTLVQPDLHSQRHLPIQTTAQGDPLDFILKRQGPVNQSGVDLTTVGKSDDRFDYPFLAERVQSMKTFYNYVCHAKPEGFKLTWSDWVIQNAVQTR